MTKYRHEVDVLVYVKDGRATVHGRLNKALRENKIKLNGKKQPLSTRVQNGDTIRLFLTDEQLGLAAPAGPAFLAARAPADIIYENDDLLIVNKPAGIPVEGSTGVADGARTGLYTAATGVLFLAATLLSPIAGVIPGAATSPALILIGMLMIGNAANIYWHNVGLALPCFLTMIMIPFTYSVADGIGVGFISYTAIALVTGRGKKVPPITWGLSAMFVVMYVLSAL